MSKTRPQYKKLTEVCEAGLIEVNSNGQIIYANPMARQIIGEGSRKKLKGSLIFADSKYQLLDTNLKPVNNFAQEFLFSSEKIKTTELIRQNIKSTNPQDKEYQYLELVIKKIDSGFAISVTDVTPYQNEISWRQHLMRIIGHEIKNPLASIQALAETIGLLDEKGDQNKRSIYLQKISIQVKKTARIVNDFLDTTLLESGGLQFHDRWQSIDNFLHKIAENFQLSAPHHWISVQTDTKSQIYFDSTRLGQVIENLLTNATKYAPTGSEIKIKAKKISQPDQPTMIKISISDQGLGISTQDQQKIFQPYFRSSQKTSHPDGLGLGLYLVQQILHHYQSQAIIEKSDSNGTTISFYLPAKA